MRAQKIVPCPVYIYYEPIKNLPTLSNLWMPAISSSIFYQFLRFYRSMQTCKLDQYGAFVSESTIKMFCFEATFSSPFQELKQCQAGNTCKNALLLDTINRFLLQFSIKSRIKPQLLQTCLRSTYPLLIKSVLSTAVLLLVILLAPYLGVR